MQIITQQSLRLNTVIPKYAQMPCAWTDKRHDFLTPREVSRQVPLLSRGELTRRRNAGLRPAYVIISGCVMYPRHEIEAAIIGGCDLLSLHRGNY